MIGHGTTLRRSEDEGITWEEIGQIISLSPPSLSRETIETTHMESTYKEFIGGTTLDAGEISMEINFFEPEVTSGAVSVTNQHLVFGDFESGALVRYRVEFPNPRLNTIENKYYCTAWEVPCVVTNISVNTPDSDRVTASITLKVAGKPLFEEVVVS